MNLQTLLSEKAGTFIALLSLLVAVAVGILQFRSKTRELTCNVVSSTELTSVSQVPGLASEFTYHEKKVIHLWKINLNFVNTGNESLVGEGQHSSLIKDGLIIGFPTDTEILNVELASSDLPINIEQKQPNEFILKFSQWRPNEKANISVFITSQNMHQSPLLPETTTRDIVDGMVNVTNAANPVATPKSLMGRMPIWSRVIVKIIISGVCILGVIVGLFVAPRDFIRYIRVVRWRRKYSAKFREYVEGIQGWNSENKQIAIDDPSRLPDDLWKNFQGERFKDESTYSSLLEATSISIAAALIGICSSIYVLSNLFDLYFRASEYF